ncbi:MAG: hypothetical protein H6858_07105 [Rhodospirillales bacterium]|nr:hypothetical protein [Rhodospirillales bacterium]
MKRLLLLSVALMLSACSGETLGGFRAPTLSGDPAKMSADTLCYRAAYAKEDPALLAEVKARNLDCGQILESQPF